MYVLPEYFHAFNSGQDQLVFEPFLRLDQYDAERSHLDIRELHWQRNGADWDLTLGISSVFWGVTESQHLVDIINQTDSVENIDGEDKLGQPMLRLRLLRDWGTLEAYLLPGFRERTFAGRKGRLSGFRVLSDDAVYESAAEQRHTDFALRWSKALGDWDLGLAYFQGTAREPRYLVRAFDPVAAQSGSTNSVALAPVYEQIKQVGLDVQVTKGAWLWKAEAIYRSGQGKDYVASTAGFEFSLYSVFGSNTDLGFLLEHQYDSRDFVFPTGLTEPLTPVALDNSAFLGLRWGFNDMQSSELLAGCSQDLDSSARFCILEGSRRLTDHWTGSLEARLFSAISADHPFSALRNDDLLQLEFTYHF